MYVTPKGTLVLLELVQSGQHMLMFRWATRCTRSRNTIATAPHDGRWTPEAPHYRKLIAHMRYNTPIHCAVNCVPNWERDLGSLRVP